MNSKKFKNLFAFIITSFIYSIVSFSINAATYETNLEKNEIQAGNEFSLPIIVKADPNTEKYAQKFSCKITINSDYITYKKRLADTKTNRNIKVEKTTAKELLLTFSPPEKRPRELTFEEDNKSKLFELIFLAKSNAKTSNFSIKFDFINPDNEEIISSNEVFGRLTESPIVENCKLSSLVSSCGELNPKFDSNIFEYSINVPSDQKEIYFDYCPAIEGLKVNINRKRLLKAGETTNIFITVRGQRRGVKNVYIVNVNRSSGVNNKNSGNNFTARKNTNVFSNRSENSTEKTSKKKLSKKKSRKKSNRSKKSSSKTPSYDDPENDEEELDYEDDDEEEYDDENDITDEIVTSNSASDNENNFFETIKNPKVWYIVILALLLLGVVIYFAIKFIKEKSQSKNTNTDINIDENNEK